MESNLPKIQIGKYVKMQLTSLLAWFVGTFFFIASLMFLIALIVGNPDVSGIIIGGLTVFGMFIGFLVLIGIIFLPFGIWRLFVTSYEMNKDVVTIRGGIIARYEKNLLFSKIQHVVITQSFWERMFGLANVIVQTAGNEFIMVQQQNNQNQQLAFNQPVIPSLLKEDAEKIREQIISKVSNFRGQGL